MSNIAQAFLLLTLSNSTVTTPAATESGALGLHCVTVPFPGANPTSTNQDVYLVLHLNSFETPIDPSWIITSKINSGIRTYTFRDTDTNVAELVLIVHPPRDTDPHFLEDLHTFEGILAQYADFRGPSNEGAIENRASAPSTGGNVIGSTSREDLRGHLVLINEDSGEILGELDNQFKIKQDPKLNERGHENDPVILEIPEESDRDQDANAMEMFVRAVPVEDQDWITRSATVVSHAISHTTNLLLTTITSASSYYISNSSPSPYATSASAPSSSTTPPPLPPRALVLLTSERTRKGLAGVHAVSGQAVKVSSRTVSLIDKMIRRAMGGKAKDTRNAPSSSATMLTPAQGPPGSSQPLSPNTRLPPHFTSKSPPPIYQGSKSLPLNDKPPLPPRQPSPVPPPYGRASQPPPLPPRMTGDHLNPINPPTQPRLTTKERLLLSANLILATIDHSSRQVLDVGTDRIGAVVGHKYGPEAAQSSLLMAGTARNVGLVYIDMRGVGRKALLRTAGKEYAKARMSSRKV